MKQEQRMARIARVTTRDGEQLSYADLVRHVADLQQLVADRQHWLWTAPIRKTKIRTRPQPGTEQTPTPLTRRVIEKGFPTFVTAGHRIRVARWLWGLVLDEELPAMIGCVSFCGRHGCINPAHHKLRGCYDYRYDVQSYTPDLYAEIVEANPWMDGSVKL